MTDKPDALFIAAASYSSVDEAVESFRGFMVQDTPKTASTWYAAPRPANGTSERLAG